MYYPKPFPQGASPEDLALFVYNELRELSATLQSMQVPFLQLTELHNLPERPRDGLVVFADGTDWNPGAGRGVYVYSSAAWVKL